MKWLNIFVATGIFLFSQSSLPAQDSTDVQTKKIEPYSVAISHNKTSNFIFPYSVKSVDRGSPAVIVQKAKGVDNILQVKANKQGFAQTNLSVITADGEFYSFLLDYAENPSVLNISFSKNSATTGGSTVLLTNEVNQATLQNVAAVIANAPSFLHVTEAKDKIRLSLQSIYLHDGMMWFTLEIKNCSLIDYNPAYTNFFIRDKKRAKRTAVQETELIPLYHSPIKAVTGNETRKLLFAFKPFTIQRTKELTIQIGEKNGGRVLLLPVNHKKILKTRLLNQQAKASF